MRCGGGCARACSKLRVLFLTNEPLVRIAACLPATRKKKIAVDVVSIGEIEDNQEKLEEFVKTVDKNNNR